MAAPAETGHVPIASPRAIESASQAFTIELRVVRRPRLILTIFTIAFIYARMQGPAEVHDPLAEMAEHMLATEENN